MTLTVYGTRSRAAFYLLSLVKERNFQAMIKNLFEIRMQENKIILFSKLLEIIRVSTG